MGGSVFALPGADGPALFTPRMNPHIYSHIQAHYRKVLLTFFDNVVTPAEAPEKPDYGDVDFLVSNDDDRVDISLEDLAKALGAKRAVSNPGILSVAVAWTAVSDQLGDIHFSPKGDQNSPTEPYAQIDIHVCPNHLLEWTEFMQAWGDFWQILGLLKRPFGLTANDQGLHVRVEEIEPTNKKASMLFLTRSPAETLEFLGLDSATYFEGFRSEQSLFEFITKCRFFNGATVECRDTKSTDRQRLKKRAMFRRFVEQVQSKQNPDGGAGDCPSAKTMKNEPSKKDDKNATNISPQEGDTGLSRQSIFKESLQKFPVEKVYTDMIKKFRMEGREKEFWSQVASSLPADGKRLPLAVRSLKRWVRFDDGLPLFCPERQKECCQTSTWIQESRIPEDELLAWVMDHWQEASRRESGHVKATRSDLPSAQI